MLVIFLLFTISPQALAQFDWRYYDTGGGFVDKFHPATLAAFFLITLPLLLSSNPFSATVRFVDRNADLVPYVLAIFFVLAYAAQVLGHSITIFIETFLGPVAMFVLYSGIDDKERRTLARLVHILLLANAALAFYEVVSSFRLTPLVVNGEELFDEPRSTSLLGHPLANALIAGAYAIVLSIGGARDVTPSLRIPVFIVALASLVPFGGRAATATCLLTLFAIIASKAARFLRGESLSTMRLLRILVILPLCWLALVTTYELGWLDTLLNRLTDDEGSAGTRIVMFELFDRFSLSELFVGPNPQELGTWTTIYGLEYGIESFIVAFILHYGILCTLVFFPCFAYFLYLLAEATGSKTTWYVIVYFIVVALTSVSLSSKSPILSVFVVMALTLLSRNADQRSPRMFDVRMPHTT